MKKQNQKIKIEKIVDLLRNSDENETFCDSLYNLYVLIGIAKGVNEMNQGEGIPLEDFLAEREEYYKKIISCKQDFNSILATYDYFKKF